MDGVFEEIKDRVSMPEVVKFYGFDVNRGGMMCCPFHDDRNPSMKIYEQNYYCFGCGESGDATGFVAKIYRSKEEKELLIAGLFKVKSEIKKKLDRVYFDRMAVSVKQNIRHSISSGNHEQARKTLAEYRQINPKDVEIEELEAMLET